MIAPRGSPERSNFVPSSSFTIRFDSPSTLIQSLNKNNNVTLNVDELRSGRFVVMVVGHSSLMKNVVESITPESQFRSSTSWFIHLGCSQRDTQKQCPFLHAPLELSLWFVDFSIVAVAQLLDIECIEAVIRAL